MHIARIAGVELGDVVARGPQASVTYDADGAVVARYDGGLWVRNVRVRGPLELQQEWWEAAAAAEQLARSCWDAVARVRHEAEATAYETCVELMSGHWSAGEGALGLADLVERMERVGEEMRERLEAAAARYRPGDLDSYEASAVMVARLCAAQLAAAAAYEWIVP